MYELDRIRNCVFSLQYHLIVVVKYRQKVFVEDKMVSAMKQIINKIALDFDVEILECECGLDHLHILFRSKPTLDITKFINILKGHSSRDIRKKHKDFLKDKLWGDHFWSPSYFLATTGNVTVDILKEYIENQRTEQE
jgi:putative transposase